jgi:hypothetical protein
VCQGLTGPLARLPLSSRVCHEGLARQLSDGSGITCLHSACQGDPGVEVASGCSASCVFCGHSPQLREWSAVLIPVLHLRTLRLVE